MKQQPDRILLEAILKKIEESNLIRERVLARYRRSIAEGDMTTEDWYLLAEPLDEDILGK
jgi:hypothetical protein